MNPLSLRQHNIFTDPSGRAAPGSQPVTVQVHPPEPMRCNRNADKQRVEPADKHCQVTWHAEREIVPKT